MLLDLVGTSLIAKAPYANDSNIQNNKALLKGSKQDYSKHSMPANARAGSMKQPGDNQKQQNV